MKIITKAELYEKGLNAMSVSRLTKKGFLGNLGYGFYIEKPNNMKFENDEVMSKINSLLDDFPLTPNRVVFSSTSLNFCINQLISGTTYVVEVEREYLQSVFELLKESHKGVVLLKPDREDKINYWKPDAIYVTELFKRSPINKDGTMTIEKLIVDLLFDEEIYSLYSGEDIDSAIDVLCSKYPINYKTEGYYVLVLFEAEGPVPAELQRNLKNDERIMRYVVERREA